MKGTEVLAFATTLLVLSIVSLADHGESLRGNAATEGEDERDMKLFGGGGGGVLSSVASFYSSLVSLAVSFPNGVIGFIVSLAIFLKNVIVGIFMLFSSSSSSSIATVPTTQTTSTMGTVPVASTASSVNPTTTATAGTEPASVTSSVNPATTTATASTMGTVPASTVTRMTPTSDPMTTTTFMNQTTTTTSTDSPTTTTTSSSANAMTTSTSSTVTTTTTTATTATAGPTKTVFLSTAVSGGCIGSIQSADDLCNDDASCEDLSGNFLAWLSDNRVSPSSRFTKSPGPYALPDGTIIANNYDSLLRGPLLAQINQDAAGDKVDNLFVWTGTDQSGTWTGDDCNGWSINGGTGTNGRSDALGGEWTDDGMPNSCGVTSRIYCFQQ